MLKTLGSLLFMAPLNKGGCRQKSQTEPQYLARNCQHANGKLCCLFVQGSKYTPFLRLFFDKWLKNFIFPELNSSTKLIG
jgi:hypothetical protein